TGAAHHGPEPVALLQRQEVLCSHGVRLPHRLVEVLAVSTAEFRGQVVDELRPGPFYDTLELAVLTDVSPEEGSLVEMAPIHPPHLVAAPLEFLHEMRTDSTARPGHQDPHR